ncbi:alpha/beta hydrolase [Nocardioides sp. GXZ039]|uniref:alpha/beta hydrolase n=1 Tax=Nocardioides sp. GXZ039 TaxID=3136018 RepID=UPI0030F405E3
MSRPSLHLLPLAEARAVYEQECAAASGIGPRLAEVLDVRVAPGVPARLYRPTSGVVPVVVYLHGGGWVLGSIETHDRMCRELAARSGCAVLSVGYRRAPEHPYPAPVDDAECAVGWVRSIGAAHGLDAGRLAVAGDSAGGNLAVALALRCRAAGVPLRLQLLFYPVTTTDLEAGVDPALDGVVLSRDELESHQDRYLPRLVDRRLPETSPLDHAHLAGLPPAVVLVPERDPIKPQGVAYAAALRASGVEAALHTYSGETHGFAQFPEQCPRSAAALGHAADAVRSALGSHIRSDTKVK